MIKVGFVGTGNMGSALAKAVSLCDNTSVYLYDKDTSRSAALASDIGAVASSLSEIGNECDFIFLGVKPNLISDVCCELKGAADGRVGAVIVSMAAGVELSSLDRYIGDGVPVIRIMPNTPVSVGRGMIEWCANNYVSEESSQIFVGIMKHAGTLDRIPEGLIDAASAIAGCGPAFAFMFIEALADGGVKCGLPRDKALMYAEQTLLGAAELAKSSGRHPEELKDAVCSPGGSTIAGVAALESGAFRSAAINAVVSAYEKTRELGK
jgi:pyrroline-5-carboxylate reductase